MADRGVLRAQDWCIFRGEYRLFHGARLGPAMANSCLMIRQAHDAMRDRLIMIGIFRIMTASMSPIA